MKVVTSAVIGASLVLSACSAGADGSQTAEPCDLALAGTTMIDVPTYSERSYERVVETFERWRDGAPAEIVDALDVVLTAWYTVGPMLEDVEWKGADLDQSQLDERFVDDLEEAAEEVGAYAEDTCGLSADGDLAEDTFESPGAVRELAIYLGIDESDAQCFVKTVGSAAVAGVPDAVIPDVGVLADECNLNLSSVPLYVDRMMADNVVSESDAQCLLDELARRDLFPRKLSAAEATRVRDACGVADPADN